MKVMLNPDCTKRSVPLLSILSLPLFVDQGLTNYVDGVVVEPVTEPVIFDLEGENKKIFESVIKSLKSFRTDDVFLKYPQILFQLIDMVYRIYNRMKHDFITEPNTVLNVCMMLVLKAEGLYDFYWEYILRKIKDGKHMEEKIVMFLDGILTCNNISRYLDRDQYRIFTDWIAKNPERYQSLSQESMADIVRELSELHK